MCLHARLLTAPGKDIIDAPPSVSDSNVIINATVHATIINANNATVNNAVNVDGVNNTNGVDSNEVSSSRDPSLTRGEVACACTSDDVDLRLAALTLLTASQRTRQGSHTVTWHYPVIL